MNVVNVAAFWSRVEVIWGGGDPVWKDGSGRSVLRVVLGGWFWANGRRDK
jgi:hypothetical protein